MRLLFSGLFSALILTGCQNRQAHNPAYATGILPTAPSAEMGLTLEVFETLASDEMEGRGVGTPGHQKARDYLEAQILKSGYFDRLDIHSFEADKFNNKDEVIGTLAGYNLIAEINGDPGNEKPVLIITAHYDHLGVRKGKVFNGADDNASGSAALFAIAESFMRAPPDHDVIFAWLDVEETGLYGAFALVDNGAILGDRKAFNLNLDMIGQGRKEIFLSGSYHYPEIAPILSEAATGTGIKLKLGYDRPKDGDDDWTESSDHFAFHSVGIPFAFLSVENHRHYHRPSDRFEIIPLDFYKSSVQTAINTAHLLEDNLGDLARARAK